MSEQESGKGCDTVAFKPSDYATNALIMAVWSTLWPDRPSISAPVDKMLCMRGAAWSRKFRLC